MLKPFSCVGMTDSYFVQIWTDSPGHPKRNAHNPAIWAG